MKVNPASSTLTLSLCILSSLKPGALLITGAQEISIEWMMNHLYRKESGPANCPCRACLLTNETRYRLEMWDHEGLLTLSFLLFPQLPWYTHTHTYLFPVLPGCHCVLESRKQDGEHLLFVLLQCLCVGKLLGPLPKPKTWGVLWDWAYFLGSGKTDEGQWTIPRCYGGRIRELGLEIGDR